MYLQLEHQRVHLASDPPPHAPQNGDLKHLFNSENMFISKDGGGAGNNWASGYTQGEAVQETLLDMIGG
jgi:tubulin gamma